MDFYDYQTMHEFFSKHDLSCSNIPVNNKTPQQFYAAVKADTLPMALLDGMAGASTLHNQAETERMWYVKNKPYYKIYPEWLPTFALTKLDVPNKYLRSPFPSILVRFPVNHHIACLTAQPGYEVRTILLHETPTSLIVPAEIDETERQFTLWIDFGERMNFPGENISFPIYTFQNIRFMADDSVEQGLHREQTPDKLSPDMKIGLIVPQPVVISCVKVVVSTCFLSTGVNKLVQPDVLNKHLNRLVAARDETTKQSLHAKAKKRGKFGWTIGRREISFPGIARSESDGQTGRHLTHSHLRSGHFHVIRYGPGKTKTRVDWFEETVVRPDLPPSTEQRGYKSKV